ncbi:MAG TPA: HD domain-containing protein [Pseudonocardiaceae bacterium]|nr:HD domain-containing protein [Pseudonocardiaceae bacterium]
MDVMSAVPHGWSGDGPDLTGPDVRHALDLVRRLAALHDVGKASLEFQRLLGAELPSGGTVGNLLPLGRARKVSVSLPEELTAAVQQRVGKGEFSHYVTEAVARQLELDLLAELAELLDVEHGPIPEEYLAEAGAAWPDVE